MPQYPSTNRMTPATFPVEQPVDEAEARYRSIFEQTRDGLVINDLDTGEVVEANAAFCAMHGYGLGEMTGMRSTAFVHPDSQHLFDAYIEAIKRGESFQCQAIDVRKDGTLIPIEVHGGSILFRGRSHVLGVIRDITERVEAYERLEQRVAERTHELATLLEVSRDVASTLELEPLLRLILEQLARVVTFIGAAIYELQDDDLAVIARRAPGPGPQAGPDRFPVQQALPLWQRLDRGESLVINDVRGDEPLARAYRALVGDLVNTALSNERSWMGVPLVAKDRAIGAITLSADTPHAFTVHHAELVGAIANQAAIAIENARLYGRAQEVAAIDERQRLARELHDSVTQSLFSMTMHTRAAQLSADREGIDPHGDTAQNIRQLRELSQGALAEMRALIFELRPDALKEEGLASALRKHAAAVSAREGLAVDVDAPEARVPLAPDAEEHLYRLAQEALHNVVKHANARRVRVQLAAGAGELTLRVIDDGKGFDPKEVASGHLGLQTMTERSERINGVMEICSAPGAGTVVQVTMPRAVSTGPGSDGEVASYV